MGRLWASRGARAAAAVLAVTLALGPSTAQSNGPAAVGAAWAAAWSDNDIDAQMALYTPDAVLMPPTGERLAGADAIREYTIKTLRNHDADIQLTSLRTAATGYLAYDSGTYREVLTARTGRHNSTVRYGSYVIVLMRVGDGSWKIVEHTLTAARMPAP
jgi:uncharacterized protein (TIGR02246 family)